VWSGLVQVRGSSGTWRRAADSGRGSGPQPARLQEVRVPVRSVESARASSVSVADSRTLPVSQDVATSRGGSGPQPARLQWKRAATGQTAGSLGLLSHLSRFLFDLLRPPCGTLRSSITIAATSAFGPPGAPARSPGSVGCCGGSQSRAGRPKPRGRSTTRSLGRADREEAHGCAIWEFAPEDILGYVRICWDMIGYDRIC
jgi:hypothetical protein